MKRVILFLTIFLMGWAARATHNRAGQITYKHLGGLEYEVTITTCTKSSSPADRPELGICWGDGTRDSITRDQIIPDPGGADAQLNIYTHTHTYPGPGVYNMEVYDPNRNSNIINIPNSVNEPFCIVTQLIISPFIDVPNNSAQLPNCPCPEIACAFQPYNYNVGAFDEDADSLSYELISPRGESGSNGDCGFTPCPFIVNYTYPHILGGGVTSINPVSGTFSWNSPQVAGEYNIAIKISEWRKSSTGNYFFVGYVTLDLQITVSGSCVNNAPELTNLRDTCIVAGSTLDLFITATDDDAADVLTLSSTGQPYNFQSSPASFTVAPGAGNSKVGHFVWNTNCSHVANTSYQVTFIVTDNDSPPGGNAPLSAYETMLIKVIPPPVQNLNVTPQGNTMLLTWSPSICGNATGYKIYRANSTSVNNETCCNGGTPEAMGYSLVGTVNGINDTSFADNGPLVISEQYCYVIVVYYANGSVSCPSNQDCAQLQAEFPIITNVSIDVTNDGAGTDTVKWFYPYQLDTVTIFNTGTFYYEVYRATGNGNPTTLVFTTPQSASLAATQRVFFDTGLFTDSNPYTYKVVLYHVSTTGNTTTIGESNMASSIFLTLTPNDNQIGLSWTNNVPWTNTSWEVLRETSPGSGIFTLVGTTNTTNYIDTGLTNGVTYCYKIKSIGAYTAPQLPSPLINFSQKECAAPVDLTAPCPPVVSIVPDCDIPQNTITWSNPNNSCADDVMQYNVYYSETDTGSFSLIFSYNTAGDTVFIHNNNGSIAGCYYVTAVDSVQYGNESAASNIVCADNCPEYWLPNVFTPNGDGDNDFLVPFPYKFVRDIDLRIYNRWGGLVFSTTDPDINWDGKHMDSGKLLSEGVYYYTCTVNTIRLVGIEPVQLHGFIHLFQDDAGNNN